MDRLTYKRVNESDSVITIDLHNGYTVMAISGWDAERKAHIVTLFLKENTIDSWALVEQAEKLEFKASGKHINSVILKQVANYLNDGFFDYYIDRYEYECKCFNIGNNIIETERLGEE